MPDKRAVAFVLQSRLSKCHKANQDNWYYSRIRIKDCYCRKKIGEVQNIGNNLDIFLIKEL